jgi:predicted GIY-YIG superfamily endonuclease
MRQQRMPQPTLRSRRQAGAPPGEQAAGVNPWCVYLLRCADGTLYAGSTTDVEARAAAHNSGRGARYTSGRRPVSVVYQDVCGSKSAALEREHALKRLTRSAKDALIAGTPGLKTRGSTRARGNARPATRP